MSPQTTVLRAPSRGRRTLAGIASAALAAGVLALSPTTAHAAEPAVASTVTGGTISWGVKESWRNYLKMPFVGSTTTAIPPATDDTNVTTFAAASGVWRPADFSVSASGGVKFTGHSGALDLTISNPVLKRTGATTQLLVDAVDSNDVEHTDLAIVDVDLAAATVTSGVGSIKVTNAPTSLTAEGAQLFSSGGDPFYPVGSAMSPLNLDLETIGAPTVSVSKTQIFTDETAVVTVNGSGFDPAAATGTRQPFPGQPGGSYVIVGYFAENWKPSASAPSANRKIVAQKWALPDGQYQAMAAGGGFELKSDGTFSTSFEITKAQLDTVANANPTLAGQFGIYTYAGSGAVGYETFTPISFVKHPTSLSLDDLSVPVGSAGVLTASATGIEAGELTLSGLPGGPVTSAIAEGEATFAVPNNLAAGSYALTVAYAGDTHIEASSDTATLTVSKLAPGSVTAKGLSATYGKGGTVTVTVPRAGSVSIPGLGTKAAAAAGTVNFAVAKTTRPGATSYVATFTPTDSATYATATVTVTVKVAKAAAAKAKLKVTKKPTRKKAGVAVVSVAGVSGAARTTGVVTVHLKKGKSSKVVKAKLKNGKAVVKLPKRAKGTWTIRVAYSGDANYTPRGWVSGGKVKVTK